MTLKIRYDLDEGILTVEGENEEGEDVFIGLRPENGSEDVHAFLSLLEAQDVSFDFEEEG